jgi:hypothetical protein
MLFQEKEKLLMAMGQRIFGAARKLEMCPLYTG